MCDFENNRSNGDKTQTQRMGSTPILCININITIDTMWKFEANADANIKCERGLSESKFVAYTRVCEFHIPMMRPRLKCREKTLRLKVCLHYAKTETKAKKNQRNNDKH